MDLARAVPYQRELWPSSLPAGRNDHELTALQILAGDMPLPITINGLKRRDINAAKNGLIRFLKEVPLEELARWTLNVPRDPEFDEDDDGVMLKSETDRKVYLHYRPDLKTLLQEHRSIEITDWQCKWFKSCNRIRTACMNYLYEFARQMDIQQPGYDFEARARENATQHVVRVLNYVPREGIIAKPHTDRCAITFHLAESASGLCAYRGFERVPCATPPTPGALCFTGQQLERITHGAIPAVYHEVEDNTPDKPRWAIVFFGKMRPK